MGIKKGCAHPNNDCLEPQYTPWNLGRGNRPGTIVDATGQVVCEVPVEEGAFIVRACNSHEELLAALQSVRNEFRAYVLNDPKNLETGIGSRVLAQIDQAIAKAEGK